jgi:hypothetical protein
MLAELGLPRATSATAGRLSSRPRFLKTNARIIVGPSSFDFAQDGRGYLSFDFAQDDGGYLSFDFAQDDGGYLSFDFAQDDRR